MGTSVLEIIPGAYLVQVIPPEGCSKVLDLLERKEQWLTAQISSKANPQINQSLRKQEILQYKNIQEADLKLFCHECAKIVGGYLFLFSSLIESTRLELCQFQKTTVGGYFRWHQDQTSERARIAVSILYLTDASDGLLGGSTDFEINGKILSVPCKKGWALMFDPALRHRGFEVFGGTKVALTSIFVKNTSPITETEKNSMILEILAK